jgi:predicted acyltransferase
MDSKRLISLDAFRGFTVAAMILVNYPGSWGYIYAPLRHAEWNGITPTDLIFPFFLFIVGVSIAFAYTKQLNANAPLRQVYTKLVIRALKIFAVGLILNLIPDFNITELRYAGVLQRIAVVFLACGILFLATRWKTQIIVAATILVGYCMAMMLIPTPGYPTAMLEPGINLAAWVDGQWLPGKLWHQTWDPEGILSTLPAMATTIMGMLTGIFLLGNKTWEQKVVALMVVGFAVTIAGYVWGWFFPINKNLWTSSFVLFTGGLALMTLGALIYLVDVLAHKKWVSIGVAFGSNAIAIYVLAALLGIVLYGIDLGDKSASSHLLIFLIDQLHFSNELASLTVALLFVALNYVVAHILHRKKIFIKL